MKKRVIVGAVFVFIVLLVTTESAVSLHDVDLVNMSLMLGEVTSNGDVRLDVVLELGFDPLERGMTDGFKIPIVATDTVVTWNPSEFDFLRKDDSFATHRWGGSFFNPTTSSDFNWVDGGYDINVQLNDGDFSTVTFAQLPAVIGSFLTEEQLEEARREYRDNQLYVVGEDKLIVTSYWFRPRTTGVATINIVDIIISPYTVRETTVRKNYWWRSSVVHYLNPGLDILGKVSGITLNVQASGEVEGSTEPPAGEIRCHNDAGCDDSNVNTRDLCLFPGSEGSYCENILKSGGTPIPDPEPMCRSHADCPASYECVNPGDPIFAQCVFVSQPDPDPVECFSTADCAVGEQCVNPGVPSLARCQVVPITCVDDAGCTDFDPNTRDQCINKGTTSSFCTNTPISSGTIRCFSNADCNDQNPNTEDVCENPGTTSSSCSHIPISPGDSSVVGDCNGDGLVTDIDFEILRVALGRGSFEGTESPGCDTNGDGIPKLIDLGIIKSILEANSGGGSGEDVRYAMFLEQDPSTPAVVGQEVVINLMVRSSANEIQSLGSAGATVSWNSGDASDVQFVRREATYNWPGSLFLNEDNAVRIGVNDGDSSQPIITNAGISILRLVFIPQVAAKDKEVVVSLDFGSLTIDGSSALISPDISSVVLNVKGSDVGGSTDPLPDPSPIIPNFECGNDLSERGEICDGPDHNDIVCATFDEFVSGIIRCAIDCQSFDTGGCWTQQLQSEFREEHLNIIDSLCGNGVTDVSSETCDSFDKLGATCESFGYSGGDALRCSSDCLSYDFSSCSGSSAGSAITPADAKSIAVSEGVTVTQFGLNGEGRSLVYEVFGTVEDARIFCIPFWRVPANVGLIIDANTGEIEDRSRPFWSIIACGV